MSLDDEIKKLAELLEKGGYNARPGKLRQGCISFVSDRELTEKELDELWVETFGHA